MLDRREFIAAIPASLASVALIAVPSVVAAATKDVKVGAIECLQRGHGLLLRTILILDTVADRFHKGEAVDPSLVQKTESVIHNYLHDFHEAMEEKYIFAPLESKNICFSSIQELKIQHGASYELNGRIAKLAAAGKVDSDAVRYMSQFVKMYMHHSAWEDTVIFPAFDTATKKEEIVALAETLANEEKVILGKGGFEAFITQLEEVEKHLGIYDLSKSTPKIT